MKYENATKADIIKALKLVKQDSEREVWTTETEDDKARYRYTLDEMLGDHFLVVERYSKTATVWSDLFGAFIPRKTLKTYSIKP